MTIIPTVIGTVSKGLLKGLGDLEVGGREETIQTMRTARILRKGLEDFKILAVTQIQVKDRQQKLSRSK